MKSGPLIKLIAQSLDVEAGTVKVIARTLREAGWLTTGARGVNAPDMAPRDGARLLIAILTGAPPSRVLSDFQAYRALEVHPSFSEEAEQVKKLLQCENLCVFEDFLEAIINGLVEDPVHFRDAIKLGDFLNIKITFNDKIETISLEINEELLKFYNFEKVRKAETLFIENSSGHLSGTEIAEISWKVRGMHTSRSINAIVLLDIADGLADRARTDRSFVMPLIGSPISG